MCLSHEWNEQKKVPLTLLLTWNHLVYCLQQQVNFIMDDSIHGEKSALRKKTRRKNRAKKTALKKPSLKNRVEIAMQSLHTQSDVR